MICVSFSINGTPNVTPSLLQASVLEEFRREVETMHSLPSHRNVLSLIGACTQPPRLAIVTEFCPLGSLYGLLHSPNCHLSWAQIIYMCLGAANGMAHLHRHHIVHRDLKSGEIPLLFAYCLVIESRCQSLVIEFVWFHFVEQPISWWTMTTMLRLQILV